MTCHHHHQPTGCCLQCTGDDLQFRKVKWYFQGHTAGRPQRPLTGLSLDKQQIPPWPGTSAHLDPLPLSCSALSPRHPYITAPPSSVPQGMYLPPSCPGSEPLSGPPLTVPGCISLLPCDLQGLTGVSVTWCLGQGWAPGGSSGTNRTASTASIGHTTPFLQHPQAPVLSYKSLVQRHLT